MNNSNRIGLRSEFAPLDIDLSQLHICLRCCRLDGLWKYLSLEEGQNTPWVQRCGCLRGPPQPTWPRFDHNTVAEFCKCCGAELLKSGSKWSVWFCEECKEKVRELNKTVEFALIPMGRHSLINGIFLPPSAPATLAVAEKYMARFTDLAARMNWLDDRMKIALPQRLGALGLASGADPRVVDYLDALTAVRVDKHREFQVLYNYFMKRIGPKPDHAWQS